MNRPRSKPTKAPLTTAPDLTASHSNATSQESPSIARQVVVCTSAIDFADKRLDLADLRGDTLVWSYVVANRRRWNGTGSDTQELVNRCQGQLAKMGLDEADQRRLAQSAFVEVSISAGEEQGWDAYTFPWEFVIGLATKPFREDRPLTVVRHLQRSGEPAARATKPPGNLCFIQSAPEPLGQFYGFEIERRVIEGALGIECALLENPEKSELEARLHSQDWDVVYLTGVDVHQAVELIQENHLTQAASLVTRYERGGKQDGLVVLDDQNNLAVLDAQTLARWLTSRPARPRLVTMNLYHSAARMTALAVAHGVEAAVGFLDTFEDELTDDFFVALYDGWKVGGWDLLPAFANALQSLPAPFPLGMGVVLWTGHSMVREERTISPQALRTKLRSLKAELIRGSGSGGPSPVQSEPAPTPSTRRTGTGSGEIQKITAEVIPHDSLNYAMLHNNREIFKMFKINPPSDNPSIGAHVIVDLFLGGMTMPYKKTIQMKGKPESIADRIKLPLASTLVRSLKEPLRTTLTVTITDTSRDRNHHYEETFPVTLLPIDEWRDDDNDRQWLPSFVQPRDPMVGKIIQQAQKYLMALRDHSGVGFNGYQSIDPGDPDDESRGVDLQVQAIWSALLYDFGLHYINPPPAYSRKTQRLRTPSEVIDGGRGTCIDLALLLAACLEYIDIYPVIFLLKNHAFPAYWRSDKKYQGFLEIDFPSLAAGMEADRKSAQAGRDAEAPTAVAPNGEAAPPRIRSSRKEPWYFDDGQYGEIRKSITRNHLAPVETLRLTDRGGFRRALAEGQERLGVNAPFDAMIDVHRAREASITPIPLGRD